MDPAAEYRRRIEFWRKVRQHEDRLFEWISYSRLGTAVCAVVLAWMAFGRDWTSGWWLQLPVAVFVGLIVFHERVAKRRELSARAIAYYERGLGRLDDQWIGTGNFGDRFRDSAHIYAGDLDIFGRGSLFELLCTARTAAGEAVLARWLSGPASIGEVSARQEAVVELRDRVDLREDIALLGEDVRAGVHEDVLTRWGEAPAVKFPPEARLAALLLAVASLAIFVLALAGQVPWKAFLAAAALDFCAVYALRHRTAKVIADVDTPAHDLGIFSLLLGRLEREQFQSPRLKALRAALDTDGLPVSRRIARLERWMEILDSSDHLLVRVIAPFVLWREQCAMAIEAWRMRSGKAIGGWIAAAGEIEALGCLSVYAYERPDAIFPEVCAGPEPCLEARQLRHPLISRKACVPNDIHIGGPSRLLIVSGSNMSGKSTLLRAVGLNAVLAWAGAPVPAGQLRISPLVVGASMRHVDSLVDGRSRFYAEISRLRQILDRTQDGRPVLFLLDELLSGTNSHDRRIGAEAVVRSLLQRGAVGLLTTHDLALADIAEVMPERVKNVHFEDHIEDGRVQFDYRLKPGVVTRSNALELMRAVGLEV